MIPNSLKTTDRSLQKLEAQLGKAQEFIKDPYFSDVEQLPEPVKDLLFRSIRLIKNANDLSIEFMQQVQNIIKNTEEVERYNRLQDFTETFVKKLNNETKLLRMVNKALKEMIQRNQKKEIN